MDADTQSAVTPRLGQWVSGLTFARSVPHDVVDASQDLSARFDRLRALRRGAALGQDRQRCRGRIQRRRRIIAVCTRGESQPGGRRARQRHRDSRLRDRRRARIVVASSRRRHAAGESRDRGSEWRLGRGVSRRRWRPATRSAFASGSAPAFRIRPAAITSPARSARSARPPRRPRGSDLTPVQSAHALGIGATQAAGLYVGANGRDDQALPCRPRLAERRARAPISPSRVSPAASTRWKRRSAAS